MQPPSSAATAGASRGAFPASHSWDRNFHLVLVALAWLGILMGFGGDIADHLAKHRAPYPLIVHVHGVVFMGWLVLFTVQILLVRQRKLGLHRKLGLGLAGLAAVMVVLGPATALHMQHLHANQAGADPGFLIVQFTDLLAFAGLVTAGLLRRQDPAAHKRLMFLGTIYITDAGFARWLGDALSATFGTGSFGFWATLYLPTVGLMLLLGAYDLATRRRLHPVFVAGLAWALACQVVAIQLYAAPWWVDCAKKIIARAW